MSKLNDEYLAGFFDADGSVHFDYYAHKKGITLKPRVSFSQKESHSAVLHLLAEEYDIRVRNKPKNGKNYQELSLTLEKALHILARMKKYSVVRIREIEFALAHPILRDLTKDEKKEYFRRFAAVRKQPSGCTREKASMQWAAGFVDGDGSFGAYLSKQGYMTNKVCVTSWLFSQEGVRLLHKTFGGNICTLKTGNVQWTLGTSGRTPEILEGLANHCIVKKDQAVLMKEFIDDGMNLTRNKANPRRSEYVEKMRILKRH